MSIISPMEWNKKNPMQWDWENLMMLDSTPTEIQKRLKPVEWYVEGDGRLDSGSLNSFGAAGGSGGSGLNLGLASLSKSSKSASINSLSTWDVKETAFMLEAFEAIPYDTSNKKEVSRIEPTGASPTLEASVGSSEPLLSLKLGKQTYFEDATVGSNPRNSSYSASPGTSPIPAKRSKSNCRSAHVLHCQVEGCNLDLSSAKDYHRKHRVCESHSKSPKVIVAGLERRFCQQCSRFHSLSEFDEKKRSCRQRLSNHNARRRKPQTEAANFNTARLSSLSSSYEGKQQMSFVQNKVSVFNKAKPDVNFTWEGTFDSVSSQMNDYMPTELGNVNRQVQLPGSQLLNSVTMQCHDFNRFVPAKGKLNTAEVLNPGVQVSMIASNTGTSQELHRALSLLSNDTQVSCEPKFGPHTYPVMHVNSPTSISQPAMVAIPQGIQHALSDNWQMDQQKITESRVHINTVDCFQEFQPVGTPYDCGFYSAKMD